MEYQNHIHKTQPQNIETERVSKLSIKKKKAIDSIKKAIQAKKLIEKKAQEARKAEEAKEREILAGFIVEEDKELIKLLRAALLKGDNVGSITNAAKAIIGID